MMVEIFEYRRQARGPKNYLALWSVMAMLYVGWAQGWFLVAVLLCGPFLAMILVRLVLNEAAGFRLGPNGIDYFDGAEDGSVTWRDLRAVTLCGDGTGGATCLMQLTNGDSINLPATGDFAPERLATEFKARRGQIWRPDPSGVSQTLMRQV
jgi:hypothetical protein